MTSHWALFFFSRVASMSHTSLTNTHRETQKLKEALSEGPLVVGSDAWKGWRLEKQTGSMEEDTTVWVRACENAQCVQLFNYLMHKNTLTVVLNGVKEWKVHRELWTGPEERGGMEARKQEEKKEKEKEKIILVERETNRKKINVLIKAKKKQQKVCKGIEKKFFLCACAWSVLVSSSGQQVAAERWGEGSGWWARLPCVAFLSLSSLVWLLGRILISGGSGLWPTRDAIRAFRYWRRVTCRPQSTSMKHEQKHRA